MLRSDRPVTESNKRKIALMCDVDEGAVVNAVDVPSIYDIPTMLNEQGLDEHIVRTLGLSRAAEVDWSRWQRVLNAVHNPKHEVTIGLVGKYIDLPDAYLSVTSCLGSCTTSSSSLQPDQSTSAAFPSRPSESMM